MRNYHTLLIHQPRKPLNSYLSNNSQQKKTGFKCTTPLSTSKSHEQITFYWKTNRNKVNLIHENGLKHCISKESVLLSIHITLGRENGYYYSKSTIRHTSKDVLQSKQLKQMILPLMRSV